MQHVAQTSESDIKLDSEINNVPKVGNSSTPSSPRSPPCSPPCTPPDTPPDRFSDSFQCLSDSSESGDEDISEVCTNKIEFGNYTFLKIGHGLRLHSNLAFTAD
ncbi:hypothetical protein PGB90_010112 [Kerria lacca]